MKIENQEVISAWRIVAGDGIYLRLANRKGDIYIWYLGIEGGFELVTQPHAETMEAEFQKQKATTQ